ncbi:MAG: amidohydrolase family protein [Victivallaceae bacterium]|nr:amidohydrolase family protein [Victivallaceae bacterium]
MIFDFHTHYYPPKIAAKALGSYCPGFAFASDGTRKGLLTSMREAGVTFALNLPLATHPKHTAGLNAWAARENIAPIYSLGSIHPDDPHPEETLKMVRDLGLRGIKVHPEYQQFRFSEERLFPIWESAEKLGLLVLTHTGDAFGFPPPPHTSAEELLAWRRRFPGLRIVLAHLGMLGHFDDAEKQLAGQDFYFDLAFVFGKLPSEQIRRIIRKHGADRILWGTDSPWRSEKDFLTEFHALGLSEEEERKILWDNAAALLNLTAPSDGAIQPNNGEANAAWNHANAKERR